MARADTGRDSVSSRSDFYLAHICRHPSECACAPAEVERQREIVTYVLRNGYATDLWAGNRGCRRKFAKGLERFRRYHFGSVQECVSGVCSLRNVSEEVEDHLYGSASLTVELRYRQGPVHYLLTLRGWWRARDVEPKSAHRNQCIIRCTSHGAQPSKLRPGSIRSRKYHRGII